MRTADSLAPVVLTEQPAARTSWLSVGHDDDRDASQARRRAAAEALLSRDAERFPSWARTHPLGLGRRRSGRELVRCVGEADFGERSLGCTAEVPQGGLAWFMRGDADSLLRSTEKACAGFSTHGEIARTSGVNAVHSQTLAVLALS
jgi:hypothetical protein